jgi:hypothetical protein
MAFLCTCCGNTKATDGEIAVDVLDSKPALSKQDDSEAPMRFQFALTRPSTSTAWGVDLSADSENALSIVSVMADGALAKANQESAQRNAPEHTLRPGSVITALGSVRTKTEMVQKLKTETGLTAEVVRFSNFTARLVKIDKAEPLAMDMHTEKGVMVVSSISPVNSAITRWNGENFEKPLVESDRILSVNGKTTEQGIVKEMRDSITLEVIVKRVP